MDSLQLIIVILAIWRITHLIVVEDGPWDLVYKLRKAVGQGFWGSLMDCFFCLSLWIALPLGVYFAETTINKCIYWLAFSGGASLLHKLTVRDSGSAQ